MGNSITLQPIRSVVGKAVLEECPHYEVPIEFLKPQMAPVTAARNFRREHNLSAPVVLTLQRTEFTKDLFFWSEKGMFTYHYTANNWMQFESLRKINTERNIAHNAIKKEDEWRESLKGVKYRHEEYKSQYYYV